MTSAALKTSDRPRTRPVVGVTGPDRGGEAAWFFTWLSLMLVGASARHITPSRPTRIEKLDALVIGGGADVDPQLYGEPLAVLLEPSPEKERSLVRRLLDLLFLPAAWFVRQLLARDSNRRGDADRDRLERGLLDHAVRSRLPVLGICRGAQLLNVYFGGSLHQSLAGYYIETREIRSIRPRKKVAIRPGTRLAAILGTERWVNSLHRQAVDRLGVGIRVAATDRNGIVQAIEHDSMPFIVGVQWHPEFLPQRPEQRALFGSLVQAARQRRQCPQRHETAIPTGSR
ncbi:gamma-glutamyl-gamma-aminobutyrate hydrolase family protein [Humisphaera borealis]|uniref:gamma-glutamyl-gamma-aminobutyrate hydrolase family protein n=1 Tax=Humisphaera borealis TaxID=2807512 RepID=UPI0019D0D213|nr:gamma-glutamyl-gamma-aminobutyrate hydrolase family protein [Humisphaera borealis]